MDLSSDERIKQDPNYKELVSQRSLCVPKTQTRT